MRSWNCAEVLTSSEVQRIHDQALRILDEIGVEVANTDLLGVFAEMGADANLGTQVVKFPTAWTERFIAESSEEYDDCDWMETMPGFPWNRRMEYSGGIEAVAGCYPQFYYTPEGEYKLHTLETCADMTRLADALPNIDRIGVCGTPSDVPAELDILYMRLVAWKNAENKLSGCGEVRNTRLLPYVYEMGRIIADYRGEPATRYTFAEVAMHSPLRLGSMEADIVAEMWKEGYKVAVGYVQISGANTPATLAATASMTLAESLFMNFLYRGLYGLKKLHINVNDSVLDMKVGFFPFARPERTLLMLTLGQIARHYKAAFWASAIGVDSKAIDMEAGLGRSFNDIPAIMAGTMSLETYGLLSTGDANSAIMLAMENEYVGAVKRFIRGFEVNEETLAWDLIKEKGIGGSFLDSEHTVEHFRQEHWQPKLFAREPLNDWLIKGRKTAEDNAREKVESILQTHYPRGMDEATEKALMDVIRRAEKEL
jgi:trimethylamine--corrinoid protein Co-methyltransferase